MSLYANEGGTLKNMSPIDSGSFKITGIDYFGDYTPSNNTFTIQLSKALGSYKYLIILATRQITADTQNPEVGGMPAVISVSKFLETAISGKSDYYKFPVICGNSGATTILVDFSSVKAITSSTTSLEVYNSNRYSGNNLIYECYGVF